MQDTTFPLNINKVKLVFEMLAKDLMAKLHMSPFVFVVRMYH